MRVPLTQLSKQWNSLSKAIYVKETSNVEEILGNLFYVTPVSLFARDLATWYLILLYIIPRIKLSYSHVSFPFTPRLQELPIRHKWGVVLYQNAVTLIVHFCSYFSVLIHICFLFFFFFLIVVVEILQTLLSTSQSSEHFKHLSSCEISPEWCEVLSLNNFSL